MELEGKTAIVTGASSGIGASTVRKLREAGVRVAGGARRVERIEADVALPLDVTDEESAAGFVAQSRSRAPRRRHPLQQRGSRPRPLPVHRVEPRGRGDRPAHERRRCTAHDAPLPPAHPRRRPHPLHGVGRGPAGVPERRLVRRREVRGARLRLWPARGSPRAADSDHDGRRGARRGDGVLTRPLQGRCRAGGGGIRRRRPHHAG